MSRQTLLLRCARVPSRLYRLKVVSASEENMIFGHASRDFELISHLKTSAMKESSTFNVVVEGLKRSNGSG